ncbi:MULTISPECIES: helix-turn-helix domain-containing protein [Catenuloplanes]|uniref:Transcriptional regulator with XRE-family HTH domain n=1 Tax=Catenuloplanes niger TaxID=587534 RepID=A0AAE4CR36_9ACTN|nr:helix-turn-helix transcriptional regulator [Catenuloplanes niger]MDR7321625.1 transcriptional regulator with XRE-family HTH domain [Catenuloplanes niger]
MSMVDPPPDARPLGPLLTALRRGLGWSQDRVAEQLCAASGRHTVTRHEISRWERAERVPSEFWRRWLATVLGADPADLARSAATARRALPGEPGPAAALPGRAVTRPTGSTGAPAAETARLRRAAHAWLATPSGADLPAARAAPALRRRLLRLAGAVVTGPGATGPAELPGLRRLDDLVGGADLAATLGRRLITAHAEPGLAEAAGLTSVAEGAQLLGWVAADAGRWRTAVAAHRVALQAAHVAGARPLAGYVLSSASHLLTEAGDPGTGLLLARTAWSGAARSGGATGRALLLHRAALACALSGRHREADVALAAARRAADRADPGHDPAWLYWLTPEELAGMTGRCQAALGRPMRAVGPLLLAARAAPGPRTAALHRAWLARAFADGGDVERACAAGSTALHDAIRAGSVRAATQVRRLQARLRAHPRHPAARRYREEFAAARDLLADVRPTA